MTRRSFSRLMGFALPSTGSTPSPARLAGTFLQLHDGHLDWPPAQWEQLFATFRALALERLVIQWTRNEGRSYLPLLPGLLARAASAGLQVDLGLLHSDRFWSMTEESRGVTLAEFFEQTGLLIDQLAPFVVSPAFRGWYIPQEFDDVRWTERTMKRRGGYYLRSLVRRLRAVRRQAPVAVSAFSNGVMTPELWARLWEKTLNFTGLDELLFQDGVGVGKLTVTQAGNYHAALRQRLADRVTPVVELFEMVRETPFLAAPAPLERIEAQLRAAATCRSSAIGFAVPDYLSPLGGAAAAALLERFQNRAADRP